MLSAGRLTLSASPCTKRMGGVVLVKYAPPIGGHSAPASTMAAVTARSRQQVLATSAATVSPPSDWPATAILPGSIRPAGVVVRGSPQAERDHRGDQERAGQ